MGKATVPALLGAAAAATPSRERVMCACGCGNAMVTSFDAIGNLVYRCPVRRVKRPASPMAPEHSFVPVRLVRESEVLAAQLPVVAPGQLRCQICACGVKGSDRYCETHRKEKLAERSREWRRAHAVAMEITCLNCGSTRPRKGGVAECRTCPSCAPVGTHQGRVYQPKPCERCGRLFTPTGPAAKRHPGGCP